MANVGYAQDILNVERILREEILPFIDQAVNVGAGRPLMELIRKEPLNSAIARAGVNIGVGGGFGMSEERQPTPTANPPLYTDFKYVTHDAYNEFRISEKLFRLGASEKGTLTDAVTSQTMAVKNANAWNTARMLYGDGIGKLATITATVTTATPSITVDDTTHLIEGLTIDIYAPDTEVGSAPSTSAVQIIAIDHDAKKVYLRRAPDAALSTNKDGGGGQNYGFVTAQNSYGREITGLAALFDASVDTVYGVKKADHPWIKPYSASAAHDVDDTIITDAVTTAFNRTGALIDTILCGRKAFLAYEYRMKESPNNVNIVKTRKFVGGSAGYEILAGSRTVTVVRDDYVPETKMWGVELDNFALRQTGWDFCAHHGSSIFTLRDNSSDYRALMANYLELICKNPGKNIEITDCDMAE